MHARVVTAKRGERHAYAPSDTPLCHSSRPQTVLKALLDLYPFDTLYIADLDAIRGTGSNLTLIRSLHLDHPEITFWVDSGLTGLEPLCEFARPVIGTESLTDGATLSHLLSSLPSPILSLDYLGERFSGPPGLDRQGERWPDDVIVMTLSRVGTAGGPDLARLRRLSERYPTLRLHAAGGIRNPRDLQQLRSLGIAGALLSTALHQGTLGGAEIARFLDA